MIKKARLIELLPMALLVLAILMSALSVIYSTYKSRQLFSALQQAYRQQIQYEEQWGRLLLEQSTWASQARIEEIALTQLNMKVPDETDTELMN